jgi:hypothetical protein
LLAPARVVLDFENALAESFVRVFPKTIICGDFFHLMQANVKRIRHLHLQSLETDVVNGVCELFYAASKDDFDLSVANFLKDMNECAPNYASYFRHTWLNHYAPEKWASFARPPTASTGIFFLLYFFLNLHFAQVLHSLKAITVDWRKLCLNAHFLLTKWLIFSLVKTSTDSASLMILGNG